MDQVDASGLTWRKSSFSDSTSDCVEVAELYDGEVGVRNSKRPDDAVVWFNGPEWAAFVKGVRAGEFD